MRRKLVALLGVAVLVAILSGCARYHVDMSISTDDMVSGTIVAAFDEDAAKESGRSVSEVKSWLKTKLAGNYSSDQLEPYDEDGYVGYLVTMEEVSIDDFGAATGTPLIKHKGDTFVVEGHVNWTDPDNELEMPTDSAEREEIIDSLDLQVSMTFPGAVTESNGKISGNKVTWEPTFNEKTNLTATAWAEPGKGVTKSAEPSKTATEAAEDADQNVDVSVSKNSSSTPGWLIPVIIAAAVIVVAAIAAIVIARSRKKATPAMAGGYPDPAAGFQPGPGQYQQQAGQGAQSGQYQQPGQYPPPPQGGPQYPPPPASYQQPSGSGYPQQPGPAPQQPPQPGQSGYPQQPGQTPPPGYQQPGGQPPQQPPRPGYPPQPGQSGQPPQQSGYPQQPGQPPQPGQVPQGYPQQPGQAPPQPGPYGQGGMPGQNGQNPPEPQPPNQFGPRPPA